MSFIKEIYEFSFIYIYYNNHDDFFRRNENPKQMCIFLRVSLAWLWLDETVAWPEPDF